MLFSSPDYPVFLLAVFALYALSRGTGAIAWWARVGVMVLLGDLVFVLVGKQPDALWDPLGGLLYRAAAHSYSASADASAAWQLAPLALVWKWAVGAAIGGGAIALGRARGTWLGTDRGQRMVARGLVVVLVALGIALRITVDAGTLDAFASAIASYGHVVVLAVLGIAIGAASRDESRAIGRVLVLFVVSSLFYQAWATAMPGAYRFLLALLLATIVLDYYLALWIEDARSRAAKRALVAISVVSNLGVLFFFKYRAFVHNDVLGLTPHVAQMLLPAGISFHTFQSLSYTVDVGRGQLRATRSPIKFATFVLFFPQLVAGPIVRAQDLLPQLETLPALELERATTGLFRIAIGLFKKIALADTLALAIVDRVFDNPGQFSSVEVLAGVYGYALQIYLDFSAYSDIAIGSAAVLGFELPENFRTPYRSGDLQQFWRRWHISLSTWLRDYLYVTLGGSRGAPWRTYVNLALTMLLGGLWHGARWTFIVWGALHGFGLAITRLFQRQRAGKHGARLATIACVAVAVIGVVLHRLVLADAGTWPQLIAAWLYLAPLWAVIAARLGAEPAAQAAAPPPLASSARALALRYAMCALGVGALASLAQGSLALSLALFAATWASAATADVLERGASAADVRYLVRRSVATLLVVHYVCLAWIFFRATTFDGALAVLARIGAGETDHANLGQLVVLALAAGLLAHVFPDRSFRWLRDRFVASPPWLQGALLAAAALALRALAQPKLVKFIYFEF